MFQTSWTDQTATSSTTTCSDAGGHYDPYLACGPSSQSKSDKCVSLGRTVDQGWKYPCSSTYFAAGHTTACEVGDFSGKFGAMMPDNSTGSIWFDGEVIDPVPAPSVNYVVKDTVSLPWASIVFHCPVDNTRILCAFFTKDKCAGNTEC